MPKPRKKSTDPVQEALRQHKSDWKDAQKEFVAHLMGLKHGLNGRGDNRFGVPPSNIKDPLPGEISSLLGALTSQFQSLVGDAGAIIAEQTAYSKSRKKKQEKKKNPEPDKQVQQQQPAQKPNEQSQQNINQTLTNEDNAVGGFLSNLSASTKKSLEIEKYGSNKLTRLWEYVKSPFSKNPLVGKRISLLSSAAQIYYSFLDLENAVLSLSDESIPLATSEYQSIYSSLKEFSRTLGEDAASKEIQNNDNINGNDNQNPDSLSEISKRAPSVILPPQEELARVLAQVHQELHVIITSSLPFKKEATHISELITNFRNAKENNNNVLAAEIYNQIDRKLTELKMAVADRLEEEKNEIKREQLKSILSETYFDTNQIVKLSHNYITRLLKKHWVSLRKSDKTSFHRLNISTRIGKIKEELQKIMNSLEKELNIDYINKILPIIRVETQAIHQSIRILNLMYQQKINKELSHPSKSKSKNIMDTVLQNEYRKNIKNMIF